MGPETVLSLFKQVFEDAPDNMKFVMAPGASMIYRDALAKLECSEETCDDLQARKDALQYMIDYMAPYIIPPVPES